MPVQIPSQAGEVVIGQSALERGIAVLNRSEGRVDLDGDVALLRMLLNMRPARGLRQVEDILHGVELDHVDVLLFALPDQLSPALLELVGDELEEDQREHYMLVFRRLDGAAQLGGGVPEGFLEGFFGLLGCLAGGLLFGWHGWHGWMGDFLHLICAAVVLVIQSNCRGTGRALVGV